MNQNHNGPRVVRCVVMRGGTTRGLFFRADALPTDPSVRDRVLMAVVGGPDPRQVDGIGGADLLLSKVAVVWPSKRSDADVECRFGSVPPGSETVNYGANCGNLTAAVALYSWQEGLAGRRRETLRIFNPDTNSVVEARLRSSDRSRQFRSGESSGMPMTGSLVELAFISPSATASDGLIPTGNAVDALEMPDGRRVPASIIDSGALYVFLRGSDLGLSTAANSGDVQNDAETMATLEHLRGQAAILCGLASDPAEAKVASAAVPKLAFVGPPIDYRTEGMGLPISADDVDLLARIISNHNFHKAYAVTGAVATASAAVVTGSVVNEIAAAGVDRAAGRLRIGHPTGIMDCTVRWSGSGNEVVIESAHVLRTARRIMEGENFLPDGII